MSLYIELAEIPMPTGAQFLKLYDAQTAVIQVSYSVRYHAKNVKRTMAKSIVLTTESSPAVTTPLQDIDTIAHAVSPSGRKRAIWRKAALGSDATVNRFVEIWNDDVLEYSWDVTETHGDFYADEYLASFCFAPSESAVLYVAEGKVPESKDPFEKFRFNPDFGEGLVGKRRPVIFLLRCEENSTPIAVQSQSVESVRFGQAVFSPTSDDVIYATGYEFTLDGRILGVKGCFNRPSGIWRLRLITSTSSGPQDNSTACMSAECTKLTPSHISCRSPRTMTDGGKVTLFWLSCKSSGAHLATSTLHSLDITAEAELTTSSAQKTLVDVVQVQNASDFPGLYPDYNLASTPFIILPGSSPSIVISSFWGSRKTILQVNTDTGAVRDLTPDTDNSYYSWSLLTTDSRSQVVCSRSSPSVPYEILLGTFGANSGISWQSVTKPALPKAVADALTTVRTSIIQIPGHGFVETIVMQRSNHKNGDSKPPCITSPHGGPHGSASTAFSPLSTALVLEGYTLSLPNYTGSPGYGEKFLQDLVGKCGDLDVEDTMAAARHVIALGISEEGRGKQFITGGSHGGFVTAHLIARYPDFFSAAVLRNPVISAGEISNTDIPDWYFSEFGLPYPISSLPPFALSRTSVSATKNAAVPPLVTVDTFAALQAASPISHIDAIKVPVLLLIGAADRRVAPSQGIEFYHALKARYAPQHGDNGGPRSRVEMLVFEGESHPLDGVEASQASFEATKEWFAQARG